MHEQPFSLPGVQTPEGKGEQTVSKRPKRRASSCGCNRRTNSALSSNGVNRQQVHSRQNNKAINQRKKTTNPHTPIIKQDHPTPTKSVSEEQSIVSPKDTNVSYTPQQEQQSYVEESSSLKKVLRDWKQFSFFQWLIKRHEL